ncbi:membrane protein [Novosphingobium marinum]|uniref:MAPEG family protein n=1 Tax=Novosphingobium marinum TaxID=1514948 RepID=A0A7Y9XU23_9SPHN|nr:MAPEG family protein [Novosphingobium marinum]NYH94601.1 hypothetical protein [Novosphingobium marinum]GGC23600.1 membrane protein [Novosphingobium marinum]
MIGLEILQPAAALLVWTMLVLLWMTVQRASGFKKGKVDIANAKPGTRGPDFAAQNPDFRDWAAHNYAHLMEQPTIFYPTVLIFALVGAAPLDIMLAWVYVALRVVHSIWQASINTVPVRATLFLVSSLVLMVLIIRLLLAVF